MYTETSNKAEDRRTVPGAYEPPTLTALGTAQEAAATQQSFFIPPQV